MRVGERWSHYKGGTYRILVLGGKIEATLEEVVVYKSERDDSVWVRPRVEFEGKVIHNGNTVDRFTLA